MFLNSTKHFVVVVVKNYLPVYCKDTIENFSLTDNSEVLKAVSKLLINHIIVFHVQ